MKPQGTDGLVNVLGIHIAPIDMNAAVAFLHSALRHRVKGYVCLTGVHGIMEAHRNPELRPAYRDSLLGLPDGMPTVWVGHWQGYPEMQQITGPDLMLEMFSRQEFSSCTHFLYGGKEGVAEELQCKLELHFPTIRVLGTYTPPFRELTSDEEAQFIATIDKLRPDIVWVGISTPKQEKFMYRMLPRLQTNLMFGVGAAFDFHTGRIKECPAWVKRAGLQWLDRLLQDPKHLWKRYLRNNPTFIWHIMLQLSGIRKYPFPSAEGYRIAAPVSHEALTQKMGSDR
jgi:N-acetylglucosaminyldiphosphoundecaprenol N-acetyl-beta-D-mannosaminyltransferase